MTVDDTLRRIFEDEVHEGLGILQADLLEIERGRLGVQETLQELLRLAHGLKGSARVVGYDLLSQVAQAMETRLRGWTHCDRVGSWEIELVLRAADLVGRLAKAPMDAGLQDEARALSHALESGARDPDATDGFEVRGDPIPVTVCSRQRLDALREGIVGARGVADEVRSEVAEVVAEAASGGFAGRARLDELFAVLETGLDRLAALSVDLDDGPPRFDVQDGAHGGPWHVLVVDDSLTMRRTVGDRLAAAGLDVTTASDGLHAHQCLASRPCAAIVTDVDMPLLDGMKLVETCARSLPIVVMTSNPKPDDEVRALASGAAAYLAKDPSIADRVLQTLLEHLPLTTPSS